MSFLVPLYIAGALAVALPVLFHLIRRTPRGEIPFSSLMFLSPSPPRITRRSSIEHWLLLLLRGLALVLLALAFARPFWRQPAQGATAEANQQRVAIVVDTSASMHRDDLWTRAVAAVDAAIAACGPRDQVGVYVCDETLRPIASFDDLAQVPAPQRRALVAQRLKDLTPTWAATQLGQGLLDAVAAVNDSRDATEEAGRAARRIVLVSDMQTGGRLNILADAAWPADVQLELKPVALRNPTNAGLWRLANDAATANPGEPASAGGRATNNLSNNPTNELRIRIANAANSTADQFELQWADANSQPSGPVTPAYVPPGESRVVRVQPANVALHSSQLQLTGDAHKFDNTLHLVPEDRRRLTIAYLGADAANDPEGLRYYVERAVTSDPQRDVAVVDLADIPEFAAASDATASTAPEASATPPLVVITSPPTTEQTAALRRYVTRGGTLLYVLTSADSGPGLAALLDLNDLPVTEAHVNDYAMLGEIDFAHPLFAPMAAPQFNDFTQIRFWRHRTVELAAAPDVHVVARFENRDPAIIEQRQGAGRIVAFAAGWQPADGQLARSWKFLIMLRSLLNDGRAARGFRTDYLVNERVTLPDRSELAPQATVTTPGGTVTPLAADATSFDAAAEPGVYELSGANGPLRFAVNIDPAESDTTPASTETFEQLGCRLVGAPDATLDADRLEQLRDVELEGRQRVWQWLVAAALAVLIVETWLAGRLTRRITAPLAVT